MKRTFIEKKKKKNNHRNDVGKDDLEKPNNKHFLKDGLTSASTQSYAS